MSRNGFCATWSRTLGMAILLAVAWAGRWNVIGSNDQFVSATPLFGIANFVTSNVGATSEPGEPLHAGLAPESTLWWKWTVPFTATFGVITTNSTVTTNVSLDTVVAVYKGNSISNLTLVAANDDTPYGEFGALWSRCVFRAHAGETMMIAVGSLGATGLIRFKVDVAGPSMNPFQVEGLYGEPLRSASFSGQFLMIDFWETICDACIEELPALIRVQNYFAPRGFTIIGLSGDAKVADVENYVTNSGINYPIGMGNLQLQTNLTGVAVAYPTKILVDQESRIVGIYFGGHTEEGYHAMIEPLLRTNPIVRATITRQGGTVSIHWPSSETYYRVETTIHLPARSWSSVIVTPNVTNGENVVTVPASATSQFFRLTDR